ncbi:uncharacterized protein N7482_001505 [Penicillium canariense]|uniref:Zn(2)-C6 fungal-type domain-containing protein n=1 Tax=Penicillium canariense TaxID=189055 RepID=A0A9W9IDH0_9EURO|nr:uncharacterized protein N7482_001505 [Penicillium canariense]KAJ5175628.1 hypothetical protein N7482_001505 [Penicillium canariense]
MALRRPHRKSRHGCMECKRRRVKCDEARPTCSNCAKRHAECEYGSSSSLLWANEEPSVARQSSRTSGSDSGQPGDSVLGSPPAADSLGILGRLSGDSSTVATPISLNLHDLELMMHWCNSTYLTLSRNDRTDLVWRNAVPEEALSHPFLMHGILALSALHLARTGPEPSRRAAYLNRAVAHQNEALALFRELLGDISESNAKAMFAFAGIVVVYTFGFPHTPDVQDPWTCVDDLYQVLVLTRGVQQVIRSPADYLSHSNFAPILQVEEVHAPLPDDATAAINELHEANEICGARDQNHKTEVYTATIDNMAEMLSWVHGGMTSSVIAGRWAIKLPSRFLDLLREREPMALVMLVHYGVLLQHLKHRWCFDEWCVRVAKAVWAILDDQWRPLVHWAMRRILGDSYLQQVDSL